METPQLKRHFGEALPVPNVQALSANSKDLKEIPQRYNRVSKPALEEEVLFNADDEEVPVIDLSRLLDPHFFQEEAKKLHFACEEWGFFQLVNHGVAEDEVVKKMKVDVEEFFKQPLETKMESSQQPGSVEGYGHAFVVSDEQKLDWADMLFLITQPTSIRNFKFWPSHPSSFGSTLDSYSKEMKKVADCLMRVMATNLGLSQPEKLAGLFRDGLQTITMNYYPPCPEPSKVQGLSPHTDGTGLTLLLQINQVVGLHIKRYNKWLPIKPLHGALIVNIGDVIEIMSNGKYKSIEHMAIVNKEKERMSIAAFHNTNFDGFVGPLPDLIVGSEPRYKTLNAIEYYQMIHQSKLDGKKLLDYMKLKK